VPQSIKEAIGRRLDRLAPQTTETLSIAAALGKQFAYIELAAVSGTDEDALLDALGEATAAQLLRPAGGDALAFTHDKICEVLYQEANQLRRRLHRRIGEALEALHRGRAEAHMADLAYHFAEAGDLERTLDHSLWAAEAAGRLFAYDDALDHLARALEAAQQLERPAAATEIHRCMGQTAYAAGRHVQAAEHFRQAMTETADPQARAALKVRVGDAYTMTGSHEDLAVLTEALRELDPETQPADLALALALIGRLHHFRAEHTQAIAALERARILAEPLDDPPALVWIYSALSGAYQHLCQFERSDAWVQACIALGERPAFLPAVCIGHEMLAENAALRGDWSAARQRAITDRETALRIGDQDRVAWSGYPLAYALHGQGQVEAARAESAASLQLADRIGDRRLSCWLEAWLAVTHADLGHHNVAARHAARAQQRAAELEQTTLQTSARWGAIIAARRHRHGRRGGPHPHREDARHRGAPAAPDRWRAGSRDVAGVRECRASRRADRGAHRVQRRTCPAPARRGLARARQSPRCARRPRRGAGRPGRRRRRAGRVGQPAGAGARPERPCALARRWLGIRRRARSYAV
jgi:tetratricopeptide (TPR) repeat protein